MANINEIISKIRSTSIPEGKILHIEKGGGWMAQIQNHGVENFEYNKNTGELYKGSKLKSGAWGRIWYDGKLKEQFSGPVNVVKNEMIKYLSSQETKDSAMEYDPVMCMMVPKKANDEYFKKGEVYKNQSGSTVKIDWYDKNGDVQYTHNKQSQSATEKGLKHMLERNGYKKVNDAKAENVSMVYDEVMAMMKPVTAKDKRTTDFSSGDAKKPFEYIDRLVTKDMNDYPREIERAKTPADCERLENAIRTTLDNVVDEYLQIWNEVGLYAQKRKNEVVDRYGKLMSQAFKKYNELKARE